MRFGHLVFDFIFHFSYIFCEYILFIQYLNNISSSIRHIDKNTWLRFLNRIFLALRGFICKVYNWIIYFGSIIIALAFWGRIYVCFNHFTNIFFPFKYMNFFVTLNDCFLKVKELNVGEWVLKWFETE